MGICQDLPSQTHLKNVRAIVEWCWMSCWNVMKCCNPQSWLGISKTAKVVTFFPRFGRFWSFRVDGFWYDGHIGRWSINCHGLNLPDQSTFIGCLKFLRYYHCLSVDGALHRSFETQWFRHLCTLVVEECLGMKMPWKDKQYSVAKICLITNTTRHPIDLNVHPTYFWCVIFVLYPCIRLYISLYDWGCHVVPMNSWDAIGSTCQLWALHLQIVCIVVVSHKYPVQRVPTATAAYDSWMGDLDREIFVSRVRGHTWDLKNTSQKPWN